MVKQCGHQHALHVFFLHCSLSLPLHIQKSALNDHHLAAASCSAARHFVLCCQVVLQSITTTYSLTISQILVHMHLQADLSSKELTHHGILSGPFSCCLLIALPVCLVDMGYLWH